MAKKKIKKSKQPEKVVKTIERMKKNRQIDSDVLREVINGKLIWVKKEIIKGQSQKKGIEIQLEKMKEQLARLEGIELFITDLLTPQKEETIKE